MIVAPRLIALDSSHYAQVAKDLAAQDHKRRSTAQVFLNAMNDRGYLLLFSFSHLEEIFRSESIEVVRDCFSFLSALPLIAWITGFGSARIAGSIVDILAFEANAALDRPEASADEIRDIVLGSLFQFGSGREAAAPLLEAWPVLRLELLRRNKTTPETASIYRSGFVGEPNAKIRDLLRRPLRTKSEMLLKLQSLEAALTADIKARGDRRIEDAAETARRFFDEVKHNILNVVGNELHPIAYLMKLHDIEFEELDEGATVDDIGNIATFRSKLRVANRSLGASWTDLKKAVTEERLPSGIIQTGLRRFGQVPVERKGSDIGDTYLACLAPYADVTFVDKRTLENFARASRKQPNFGSVVRRVERAARYDLIPDQLNKVFTTQ